MSPIAEGHDLGPAPRLEFHPPSVLISDERYQRSLGSKRSRTLIGKIARSFYWPYFGVVVATDNGDGTFCIIDGQHRVEAAKQVAKVRAVPVMVLDHLTLAEQAQAFIEVNLNRVQLNPIQIHRASVRAGDPLAVNLNTILAKHGLTVAPHVRQADDRKDGEILCVRTLARILKTLGDAHLDRVVSVVVRAYGPSPGDLVGIIFKAVSLALGEAAADQALAGRLAETDAESWIDRARARSKVQNITQVEALVDMIEGPS